MKFEYRILPELKLVAMRVEGKPTLAEVKTAYRSVADNPTYQLSYFGVADFRKVQSNLTGQEVEQLADWVVESRIANGRWAILVAEPLVTAFAMLYVKRTNPHFPNRVFSEVSSASFYLGVDLETVIASFET